ncbi:MAG: hypothetical protein VW862_02725 [Euryarchaeota archaeon]
MGDGVMKLRFAIISALILLFSTTVSGAGTEGGVNIDPVVEETIFSSITHTEITTDLETWDITMTLNQDAFENNTTFTLTTQICNNEGVCLPPENAEITTQDNQTFTSSVMTIDDHSYVNWRVTATYTSDNDTQEKFPSSGFYKTWSDCWYHKGEWGGDGCEEDVQTDDSSEVVPFIGLYATVSCVVIAAIMRPE